MAKITVRGKELAQDIHLGMGDSQLMEKYQLRPKQLEMALRKLLEAGLITDMQLYERTSLSDSMITKAFVESEEAV